MYNAGDYTPIVPIAAIPATRLHNLDVTWTFGRRFKRSHVVYINFYIQYQGTKVVYSAGRIRGR